MSLIISPRQLSQRAEFYHQINQLTMAGIPVIRALEQIEHHPPAASYRVPIQRLLVELAKGAGLAESLEHLGWLPDFDVALIGAGEQSGRLDNSFRALAEYYQERGRLIQQVITQLLYPLALVHFAALIFLVVLPFAHSQFNASLPLLCVKAALVLAPFYAAGIALVYATQSKHGERWRALVESVLRPVPVLGRARHYLALSRLAAALEALISAGVNIFEAWEMAATASGSPALRRAVAAWRPRVTSGQMPSEVVRNCRLFPDTFANLYASGEVSGKLDESLRNLHRLYGEDGTRKLHAFAQWTPRLLYILVALIIAWQIIGFYAGYFNQVSNIIQGF